MFNWLGGSKGNGDDNKKPDTPKTNDNKIDLGSGIDDEMKVPESPDLFDPTVLERVASAATILKDSPHAVDLIDLAKQQEKSWQDKFQAIRQEAELKKQEAEKEKMQLFEEERRRTAQFETQQRQERARYEDQLARKRYEEQLSQQAQVNQRERQAQEQSVMRQEQERRKSMEYDAELRRRTELEKVKMDAEYRTRQERDNRDIRDAQLVLQAEQNRITVLKAISAAGATIGDGFKNFISDTEKVTATVGVVTALAIGIYSARSATGVASQYFLQRLTKPPLVRDTSRKSFILNPMSRIKSLFAKPSANPLEGIVLNGQTQDRLREITVTTSRARRHGAAFRNLMLWGPPGTGKTMFARRLAQQTGLDYAVLAGGDVGPLGKDAVTEIHRVFDWAKTSRRGLVLFVDEADAFLRKRGVLGDGHMSEETRNALSTFLYRTGDPSKEFMLVLSTNDPEAFDPAVTDRVDEVVRLGLPGPAERKQLLDLYFSDYVVQTAKHGAQPITLQDDVKNFDWNKLVKTLDGFSGRQIAKLANAWQAAALSTSENKLDAATMWRVVDDHVEQLKVKNEWARVKV